MLVRAESVIATRRGIADCAKGLFMGFETVYEGAMKYWLIAFDAHGRERTDDPNGLVSERVCEIVARQPITDVFIFSHGWQGDVPAAREQYGPWINAMAACGPDMERSRRLRTGFNPLLLGLHWPSLPWGDESLASFAFSGQPLLDSTIKDLVEKYAARLADTPAAREALQTILTAALDELVPTQLPPKVREAYMILDHEAGLRHEGVGAPPGADSEPFDPDAAYAASQVAIAYSSLGAFGGLLDVLRQLSFWKMKDRARSFGEMGAFRLVSRLQQAVLSCRDVRFHLIGHSFGCIVASAIIGGRRGRNALPRPVHSVSLIQGALSLSSYAAEIPVASGRVGYFRAMLDGGRVLGPVITTQSEHDLAVGHWYPLAARPAEHVVYAMESYPAYGALGAFGAHGPGVEPEDRTMLASSEPYSFRRGKLYNLDGSQYICHGDELSGAHSDITGPEVAHAVWEAAIS
jgi:hypothetical protein